IPFASIFCVNEINSSTLNCSGRRLKTSSSLISSDIKLFKLFRNVFLRWLKADFTIVKKNFSLQGKVLLFLRIIRITPDFTLGGGVNTCSETVNKYSVS